MESLLLRTVREEVWGHPWYWVQNSGIYLLITVFIPFLILIILDSLIIKGICALVIGFFILVYIKYLSTPEKYNSTIKRILYTYRAYRGKTIIPKYSTPIEFLKEIVPLEAVHPTGIIQFTRNRYGVLFRLYVPTETEGGLETFVPMVVSNFVNRIVETQTLKVFATNRYVQSSNIINEILEAMNDSAGRTPEQIAHLESIYRQLTESVKVPTQRYVYMFLGLGFFGAVPEAESALKNILPRLKEGFAISGITGIRVIDPNEIALAYRRCLK